MYAFIFTGNNKRKKEGTFISDFKYISTRRIMI